MEDYIWVKLSLVNTAPAAAAAGGGLGGGSSSWGGSLSPSSGGGLGQGAPGEGRDNFVFVFGCFFGLCALVAWCPSWRITSGYNCHLSTQRQLPQQRQVVAAAAGVEGLAAV
jgi:hypothetical protein